MARSTQDSIFFGAIEAFSENGFNETTMDFIAEKAGVAKGTLYYNFKSKDELFSYVMKRGIHSLTDVTREVLGQDTEPGEKWEEYIRVQLDFFEQNRSFFRLLMQNVWGPNIQDQVTLHGLLGDYFQIMDEELIKAQKQQWLSQAYDIQTLSAMIFGMMAIPALRAVLHDQPINEEKRVKSIIQMVLPSMKEESGNEQHERKEMVD